MTDSPPQSAVQAPKAWTIGSLVKWATDDFRARGIENPRLDAELIVAHALGIDRMRVILDAGRPLEGVELAKLRELVKRRRSHEPMAYLLGAREFYGLRFRVDGRVLVPRPDTETLVDVALARTRERSMSMRLLDLCTGSGCVAIAIARQRPTAQVFATDLSADAIAVARDNAHRLGAHRIAFLHGDLASAEIPTLQPDIREFEPKLALDGGADGLDIVRRIVREAPERLARGGVLAMEIGAGQAPATAELMTAAGFADVRADRDLGRIERVVSGVLR